MRTLLRSTVPTRTRMATVIVLRPSIREPRWSGNADLDRFRCAKWNTGSAPTADSDIQHSKVLRSTSPLTKSTRRVVTDSVQQHN